MADDQVDVRITADANQVKPGVDQAKSSVSSLRDTMTQLNASVQALTSQMKEGFASGASGARQVRDEIKNLEQETKKETASLREMALHVQEGVESFNKFKRTLSEIAEVWMAALAIERIAEWAERMGAMAERTVHLGMTFGMTTDQIQQLGGIAAATDTQLETLTKGVAIFDRNLVNMADGASPVAQALKAIGVSAEDGRTQMERLEVVGDHFKTMDDGPKKVALAMDLFGRSGAALIPILNMGSEGIAEMNAKMAEYGVANAEAVEKGMQLAEAMDENKIAMLGVSNVLTDAFAPMLREAAIGVNELIKGFIESYQQGGFVKIIFSIIADAAGRVSAVVSALAEIFAELWSVVVSVVGQIASAVLDVFGVKVPAGFNAGTIALNLFKDTVVIAKDIILLFVDVVASGIQQLIAWLQTFAVIARDALSMNWSAISADWQAGMNRLDQIIANSVEKIRSHATELGKAVSAMYKGEALPGASGGIALPKGGDADTTFDFTPKPQDKGPSVVDKWKTELSDLLAEEKNWGADETALSLAFWQEKIQQVQKGSKEELEIRREINRLKLAEFKQEQQDEIAAIKQTEAIKLDQAKTESQLTKIGLQEKIDAINAAEKADQISASRAVAERNAVNRQLSALDAQEEEREYQLKMAALQDQLALDHLKPQQRQLLNRQIELLEKQHLDRMALLNAQADQKMRADDQKLQDTKLRDLRQLSTSWAQNISQMLTLQQSFTETIRNLWQAAANLISNALAHVLEQYIEQWLETLIIKKTTGAVDRMAEVTGNAAVAGSAAYASTAAIPIIGPALAPAAAATAFAGAMSFAPIASAAGGFDIPSGINPLVQAHAEEMVLPSKYANVIRDMAEGRAVPPQRGGDTHYHDHTERGLTPSQIMENRHAVAKALKMAHREGAFVGTKIAV